MKLARTIHFDDSDRMVFDRPAAAGEWAVSGGFEFSNWTEEMLKGKPRQAFANGWLGLGSHGRATFVAVAQIEAHEHAALVDALAAHFVDVYGAPDLDAARPAATAEIAYMAEMCEAHDPNTLLTVLRELTEDGVREEFRHIKPQAAEIDMFAVHGSVD